MLCYKHHILVVLNVITATCMLCYKNYIVVVLNVITTTLVLSFIKSYLDQTYTGHKTQSLNLFKVSLIHHLKQEWLWAFWNKIQTYKRFKRTLFIRTKHNMRIFRVISFIKLQTPYVVLFFLVFLLISSVLLNLWCVWIISTSAQRATNSIKLAVSSKQYRISA